MENWHAKKKKLNVNGHSITYFSAEAKSVKSEHTDEFINVIHTNEDAYKYDIRADERIPDINVARDYIEASLEKAKQNFLKVEISEYKERFYLFFNVQSIGQIQYTGNRI
ncbi:hypothetical protein FJU30_26420 [Affinibrenneria salicis]|uniref:Uncharacterized protein n=1 Tax=Affinibrenneria salicis TaxID=2590031 RepID=A0A5J5FPV4_9GAMM|nr:hypothetical protein [Affinibrenneria salicis]KAA8993878.1 hypothetical protein FJU30_26420 [Affinibrenneria salicis]